MFCSNCGKELAEGTRFCPNCGTPVTRPEGSASNAQANPFEQNDYTSAGEAGRNFGSNPSGGGYQSGDSYQSGDGYQSGGYQYDNSWQNDNPVIPNRSVALYIVLTIITCGLFGIYWLVVLVNDLNTVTNEPGETSGIAVLLLGWVTCNIYNIYWLYKAGNRLDALKAANGEARENRGIISLILSLFGLNLVAWDMIQNDLNKLADVSY